MKCELQPTGTVYPLERKKREKDVVEDIKSLGIKYNIHEIIPISTKDICVAQWVRLRCKYGCNK